MHDVDEDHGFAVLLVVVVLIAIFVYCRVAVGGTKDSQPLQTSTSKTGEKAASLIR